MKKRKSLFALTFMIVLLFYRVDAVVAMAAEQNIELATEPDGEQSIESAAGSETEQNIEPAAEPEPEPIIESVAASTTESAPDFVSTGSALIEWLESHKNTGGTVKLADHVVLDGYYCFCPDGMNRPSVFIDTDKYTITVAGEIELMSDNHLTLSGQPDGRSIFYVAEKGMLSMLGVAVESGQCALWQEEGAGLVIDDCHISGSVHYADTPFVMDQNSVCVVVEKGQTVNDVLPAQISCTVNRQGQVSHNELVSLAWNLEGCEKQQEERLRFQLQGSFLHAASAGPVLCTVVYNDYPLTFTDVKAWVSGSMYLFRGGYTKPEGSLPITVMSEYSFDGENWFMYEETTDTYAGFFIAFNSEQYDKAANSNIYIRLRWNDNGTGYFSNVLCYAADSLEHVEDIGGSRGGGTSITNPPDQPQKSTDDTSSKDGEPVDNANHNANSGNTESEAPSYTNQAEQENEDINSNAVSDDQASNAEVPNEDAGQTLYSVSPNTNEEQSLYAESEAVNAGQSSYTETKTDNNVSNADNPDMKESVNRSDFDVLGKRDEAAIIATGFVMLAVISGIAGFCVHSRSGTNR